MRKRNILLLATAFLTLLAAVAAAGAAQTCHGNAPAPPTARFAVISDPHFYDTTLGTTGSAFEAYLAQDRKMIRESEAILNSAIIKILAKKPDFVIVSGDLTKDGEKSSHQKFARRMALLEAAGIKVYVCPGNHDVNNPDAFAYDGDTETPVPNVSPQEFKAIYRNFGYKEALDRDPASLSYLVEPVKGLWVLSIDSCKYEDNLTNGYPETGGAIRPATMAWIQNKVADAQRAGKTIIAFMHHGVTEHYTGQSIAFPDYVVDDWKTVSQTLADSGLRLVFTGHYHANDITRTVRDDGGPTLFDVETGSLVTYPSPIRMVSLQNGQASLHTENVTSIKYDTGGVPFPQYAKSYLYDGLLGIALHTLLYDYGLPQPVAEAYAPYVANAFMAHYAGDEQITPEAAAFISALLGSGNPTAVYMGQMVASLWTDLPPADTCGLLDLADVVQTPAAGDLNGDGKVDAADTCLMLFHINQPADVLPAADLNSDGMITMLDIWEMARLRTRPVWKLH
jgi:3',5'-cyclic AMP phosphodiesterase CpdA